MGKIDGYDTPGFRHRIWRFHGKPLLTNWIKRYIKQVRNALRFVVAMVHPGARMFTGLLTRMKNRANFVVGNLPAILKGWQY